MPFVIYKYEAPITDKFTLEIPCGGTLLHFGIQNNQTYLWILHRLEAEKEVRTFKVVGTGHHIAGKETLDYVGTVTDERRGLVWHLFECLPEAIPA